MGEFFLKKCTTVPSLVFEGKALLGAFVSISSPSQGNGSISKGGLLDLFRFTSPLEVVLCSF